MHRVTFLSPGYLSFLWSSEITSVCFALMIGGFPQQQNPQTLWFLSLILHARFMKGMTDKVPWRHQIIWSYQLDHPKATLISEEGKTKSGHHKLFWLGFFPPCWSKQCCPWADMDLPEEEGNHILPPKSVQVSRKWGAVPAGGSCMEGTM